MQSNIVKKSLAITALAVAITFTGWVWLAHNNVPAHLGPSGNAAYVPQANDSFSYYIAENRRRIREVLATYYYAGDEQPFGAGLPLEQVLDMRSPFELLPSASCPQQIQRGFLLVHGLTDSPYLLRAVANSLQAQFPCALIRTLLSPGHSTVPGDLLGVRLADWETTFAWGVQNVLSQVDELTVLGYSNGSALALNYLNREVGNADSMIDRMILVSPGLRPADRRAWLAPWLKFLSPWIYKRADLDAVKYESFPTNAASEFYKLTQQATADDAPVLNTPTLMIVSGDDTTTDAAVAADVYCNRIDGPEKALLWYQSSSEQSQLPVNCEGIELIELNTDSASDRVISLSHIALTTPMNDPHYGIDGRYPVCLSHEAFPDRFERCLGDNSGSVYAESTFLDANGLYEGAIVRRTSFNPDFDSMMNKIACFIRDDCH